jgi:hypothetical protein
MLNAKIAALTGVSSQIEAGRPCTYVSFLQKFPPKSAEVANCARFAGVVDFLDDL